MFIKVHEKSREVYVNTDNVTYIHDTPDCTLIATKDGKIIRATEHATNIMKIIGYFTVANDK